jgi:hypothetical protein
MQTDNVLDLDVVVAGGRNLTCSAMQNADLFDAVRAGTTVPVCYMTVGWGYYLSLRKPAVVV